MNAKIKEWYQTAFPSDEMGNEMNAEATFKDLSGALEEARVYEVIGVGDSIIRERLFSELATIEGVDYSVIYNKWLGI